MATQKLFSNPAKNRGIIFLFLSVLAAIILVISISSNSKTWKVVTTQPDTMAFLKVLGIVLVFAVIVERLVEAFTVDSNQSEKAKLSKEILLSQNAIEENQVNVFAKMHSTDDDENEVKTYLKKTKELTELQSERRKKVVPLALGLGIVISMSGILFIEQLVQLPPGASDGQRGFFLFIDILLSGTLIGGGSDFVHGLIKMLKAQGK